MSEDTTTSLVPTPMPPADTSPRDQEFTFDRRQEFTQSIRRELADLDRQIADLASQAKSRGGAVSDQALANIRASRRALDGSLGRLEAATAANWEQMRDRVNQAVENLDESIQAAQPK
jgi:small-conductance mechanosensitive channel